MTQLTQSIVPSINWISGGPGGQQRLIPDPQTGELIPYQRTSAFAQTLNTTYGLDNWKAWRAIVGAHAEPALAEQARAATETPGRLIERLAEAGGSKDAAKKGSDHHQIVAMALQDIPLPTLPREAVAELKAILAVINGLGTLIACESATVCDEYRTAGTCDFILRDRAGQALVCELKTGKSVDPLSCGLQLIAHARGYYWSGLERGLPVATEKPRLIAVHAPQSGAPPRAYEIDVDQAAAWAYAAVKVRAIRSNAREAMSAL